MFQRRAAMTFTPPRIVVAIGVLGGLIFAAMIVTGIGVISGDLDWSQATGPQSSARDARATELFDRVPVAAQGWIMVGVGIALMLATLRDFPINAGWRSSLEYEEKADGIELSSYRRLALLPPKRFHVPRRAHVVLFVQRELASNYGTIKHRRVTVVVDGKATANVPVTARVGEDPFLRVSFAPLRDIVERQGGTVVAEDPALEDGLFSPARRRPPKPRTSR